MDCLFCKIVAGDIPADIVYESDTVLGFRDINAQAPTHVLVIPRGHVTSLDDPGAGVIGFGDALLAGCRKAAEATGVAGGYRVVTNTGPEGGQEVMHLHLHVLGGRQMGWPPG